MNAGNVKPRAASEINLEEFERRLRASLAPQAGIEDPLAELTRLVDTIGFDRAPERPLDPARPPRAAKPDPRADMPAPLNVEPQPVEPSPATEPVVHEARSEQEPNAEPPLRPTLQSEAPPAPAEEEPWVAPIPTVNANVAPPPRANNWGLKVGGLIAAAAVMVGAVVVFKVGGGGHSGAPPLILASTAPTKVPPPSADTVRTANESGALLTRDTAQPTVTPPKLVNAPEAPVDLAARPTVSPAPGLTPSATPSAGASDLSPVAPSSNTPIVVAATPGAPPDSPVGDDPNRVKTISVRPDGSLISSGYEANAATAPSPAPTPTASPAPVTADADTLPSTPGVALPTKLSPPKTGARVVSKSDTTAPADAGDGPAPVAPKAKKPKAKTAAESQDIIKTDDAKPADDAAAAPEAASGGFAVQLAAPRSEAEAKALIKRLSSKYADALGGTALGVRKADRKGETIYRVRAGGLSRDDAKSMCVKIKSAGGDCYIAKN